MSSGPYKKYIKANEEAWDEVTPIHQSYRVGQEEFFGKGGCTLDKYELEHLPDLHGKAVAHLCCNCGQDTISLVNLGATCTGFDQSEKAILEAKKLSIDSGKKSEFVKSDVLEISRDYFGKFDMVYMSIGVLVWIPDIGLLMKNASSLLKKGGELFIYDQHPFVHLFDPESLHPMEATFDYFDENPTQFKGLDYLGGKEYVARPNFQFMVRLSDLLNGIIDSGMRITRFLEFNHTIEDSRPSKYLKDAAGKTKYLEVHSENIPGMMLVRARKE